ncbi:hypothetical protein ACFL20_05075 [Spirochaetota bacterium]
MKKIFVITAVLCFSLAFTSCRKGAKSLAYSYASGGTWLQADVSYKGTKNKVMWFQLFDQVDKKDEAVKRYKNSRNKVAGNPATTVSNSMVWVLIADRYEIRLIAASKSKDYKNKKKLVDFINKFDLSGMKKAASGPKLTGEQLKKFAPKLPGLYKKK